MAISRSQGQIRTLNKRGVYKLRRILEEINFPTISKVGTRASIAAAGLVLRAKGERELQWGYLMMMKVAASYDPSDVVQDKMDELESHLKSTRAI